MNYVDNYTAGVKLVSDDPNYVFIGNSLLLQYYEGESLEGVKLYTTCVWWSLEELYLSRIIPPRVEGPVFAFDWNTINNLFCSII
jgi:hypothetical protein